MIEFELQELDQDQDPVAEVRLSEVISALSYALDITEGQPEGHAARSCLIGMQLGQELGLSPEELSALFYALLLKDLGCSSNAAKMSFLFAADDRVVKRDLKTIDWSRMTDSVRFMGSHLMPDGSPVQRVMRSMVLALEGPAAVKKMSQTRCDRGAEIARRLGFPEATANAIRHLDEHWDGHGQPAGLKGQEISLPGRIVGLAQTVEVFFSTFGIPGAVDMVRERRGRWFDPQLVDAFLSVAGRNEFWGRVGSHNPLEEVALLEPEDRVLLAHEATLDRIARAFAQIVDAKSPWTFRHSDGVARIAVGMANVLGLTEGATTGLYRAALLHDIGKLGVSNLILDKPGKLTDEEYAELKKHPAYSQRILERVSCFQELAEVAGSHHERLDGRGYYRGLSGAQLGREARLLAVADVCEALSASRPYRGPLEPEQIQEYLEREAGKGYCAECIAAYFIWRDRDDQINRINSQLAELDRVMAEL